MSVKGGSTVVALVVMVVLVVVVVVCMQVKLWCVTNEALPYFQEIVCHPICSYIHV